jgi:hypothetical protein
MPRGSQEGWGILKGVKVYSFFMNDRAKDDRFQRQRSETNVIL